MSHTPLPIWCAALTIVLVGTAMITDLRSRRIPNFLTLPALALAIVLRFAFQGWAGFGLAAGGAVLAPTLLLVMHGGKGLGMGDIKLAMAIGAILGPVLAATTMILTAIVGGFMGVAIMIRRGGILSDFMKTLLIGLPFKKKAEAEGPAADDDVPAALTMPYGVALGVGSLITLAVCWWTGQEAWFLSFVGIAGSQ
jgi:prepilin peptidase CpaA